MPFSVDKMQTEVTKNIRHIEMYFMHFADNFNTKVPVASLVEQLDLEPVDFRSIAYEAVSMKLGYSELTHGTSLTNWHSFYQQSESKHGVHIKIGLGWAFAKANLWPDKLQEKSDIDLKSMSEWLYDGIGYYYGLFKGRPSIKEQKVPHEITKNLLAFFDRGLGRRLWYHCKGSPTELEILLNLFDSHRIGNLWQGVGLACAYVDGYDSDILKEIEQRSNIYSANFQKGFQRVYNWPDL